MSEARFFETVVLPSPGATETMPITFGMRCPSEMSTATLMPRSVSEKLVSGWSMTCRSIGSGVKIERGSSLSASRTSSAAMTTSSAYADGGRRVNICLTDRLRRTAVSGRGGP